MSRGNLNPQPKTTSLKIKPEVWKAFKIKCVELERPMKECLEEAILMEIERGRKQRGEK